MNEYLIINLQLFAEVQTTLLAGLTPEMKTFYDMTLIDEATANLVHDQFGQKRPIPKNGGKTIEFRKFAPLAKALTPLTEGVTPDGKSLTVTAVTATVSQYGDFITQSDVLELTALDLGTTDSTLDHPEDQDTDSGSCGGANTGIQKFDDKHLPVCEIFCMKKANKCASYFFYYTQKRKDCQVLYLPFPFCSQKIPTFTYF